MTKISVISVVFNLIKDGRKETFKQMVESVANQTYSDIEHVIIDGGSTDGSVDLIKEYSKKYKKITWISEIDNGVYDAMNKGAKLASGEYIIYLNSDDFYHDDRGLENCINAIEENNADFSYSKVRILSQDNSYKIAKPNMLKFLRGIPFGHQGLLMKKAAFFEMGEFDYSFKIAADCQMILGMLLKDYKGIFVEGDFVNFREGGVSGSNEEGKLEKAVIYQNILSKFKKYTKDEWVAFAQRKMLPLGLLWRILISKDTNRRTKIAALYEIRHTIRRGVFR